MTLNDLLEGISYVVIKGKEEILVSDICYDSRRAVPGCVFVCIPGTVTDGHYYLKEAIEKGAAAVVLEHLPLQLTEIVLDQVSVLLTEDCRKALAIMSSIYFGHPDRELRLIGVTGTKGKTTVSYMIKAVLEADGRSAGLIGTNGSMIGDEKLPLAHTTPPSYEIYRLLRQMVDRGCEYVIMEVSSQGLKMSRVWGMEFAIGIFTNISIDHIGTREHRDFDEYLYWKGRLFSQCRLGIVNRDDHYSGAIKAGYDIPFFTFGMTPDADCYCRDSTRIKEESLLGTFCKIEGMAEFCCNIGMPGQFNVANGLAAITAALLLGCGADSIQRAFQHIRVKGRTELVHWDGRYHLMIDYAHNAVSMESLLKTLREYEPGRIVCIFGCGGNRSSYRRYAMGKISGLYADLTILTEDNSRDEPLMEIIQDIIDGLKQTSGKYLVIPKRDDAIYYSMRYALEGDVIVLAGKGHEDYIEESGKRRPFCEEDIVKQIAEQLKEYQIGEDI